MDKERPPEGDLTDPAVLQAATEQSRYDFLQTDLALCFTFSDLVRTELELGDREAAERIFSKAETGYATIARFLADVQNLEHRRKIEQKLIGLRTRLDRLKEDIKA